MCINAFSVSALADTAVTERALTTLNSIRTLYAEFKQYDQDGNRWSGKMWLERPGKLRFEYDPPELDKDVEILAEGSAGKTYFITAAQNSLLTDAKVTIIFELGAPDQILGWTVAEDGGKTMHVNLINPVIGSPINEDIFQYQPPTPKYPNN
jgi:outer membrane lipoprotein-sorting protein